MIHIDEVRAIELLEKVVARRGEDCTYESSNGCYYALGGEPSCAIGCALSDAGLPVEILEEMDESFMDREGVGGAIGKTSIDDLSSALFNLGMVEFSGNALKIFVEAQTAQDREVSYGEMLRRAKAVSEV